MTIQNKVITIAPLAVAVGVVAINIVVRIGCKLYGIGEE